MLMFPGMGGKSVREGKRCGSESLMTSGQRPSCGPSVENSALAPPLSACCPTEQRWVLINISHSAFSLCFQFLFQQCKTFTHNLENEKEGKALFPPAPAQAAAEVIDGDFQRLQNSLIIILSDTMSRWDPW